MELDVPYVMVSLLARPVTLAMKTTQEHATNALLEPIQHSLVILAMIVLVENGQVLEPLIVLVNYSFDSLRIIFFSSLWSWMYFM